MSSSGPHSQRLTHAMYSVAGFQRQLARGTECLIHSRAAHEALTDKRHPGCKTARYGSTTIVSSHCLDHSCGVGQREREGVEGGIFDEERRVQGLDLPHFSKEAAAAQGRPVVVLAVDQHLANELIAHTAP
jgi:hypothetical protein